MIKSQQRFQFTLKGVRRKANSGMTLHTLVHSSDTFSCHCNSINTTLPIVIQEQFSHFFPLLQLYKSQCIFQCNQINFLQQCIQISTRINSSSVHTYICVCFIHNVSNIQHIQPMRVPNSLSNLTFDEACYLPLFI